MAYYKISIGVCVRINKDQKKINKYKIKNCYIDIEKALNDKNLIVFSFFTLERYRKKNFKNYKINKKTSFC